MKKLQAFCMAFVLFLIFALCVNEAVERVSFTDPGFSTWYSAEKDRCIPALAANLGEATMIVMGSSEFNHGKKTKYHIKNMFTKADMDVLLIGQPYSQCFSHAINLAALAPDMKYKKAVLLLSPTWFKNGGMAPEAFAARFSDSAYVGMLTNSDLSTETRKAIAARAEDLSMNNVDLHKKVRLYNAAFLGENAGYFRFFEGLFTGWLQAERERAQLAAAVKENHKNLKKAPGKDQDETVGETGVMPSWSEWETMWDAADAATADEHDNPLNVSNAQWEKKFAQKYLTSGNLHRNTRLDGPNEYNDLKLFLQIAKEEGIETEIVLLPVNAYWYDYTSLGASQRELLSQKVAAIAEDYGAKEVDLSDYSYEPGLLTDAVHPWQKGWLLIDETIYSFYTDTEPAD